MVIRARAMRAVTSQHEDTGEIGCRYESRKVFPVPFLLAAATPQAIHMATVRPNPTSNRQSAAGMRKATRGAGAWLNQNRSAQRGVACGVRGRE